VHGRGPGALSSPAAALDLGNSGTSLRLLTGLLAGLPLTATLTGDHSLTRRPMQRVLGPLRQMGADLTGAGEGTAPIAIRGRQLNGIRYRLPVASAQLKSALLLAGLFAEGETWIAEPGPARDHTERMLPAFGAPVRREGQWIGVSGNATLTAAGELAVPGDISSAAFLVVAALIVPGSELVIENVGVNPTRTGILDILARMGAAIALRSPRLSGREPVADLYVKSSPLTGVTIAGDLLTRAIDEVPVLCIAAAVADGATEIRDARELRVKESDRLASMAGLLTAMGARVTEFPDGLRIEGRAALRAAEIDPGLDHRVAMSAAVAGLVARGETVVKNADTIASSFPGFESALKRVQNNPSRP
jgi:3-phosphoshikimate 1-carboxyvinyltransferase